MEERLPSFEIVPLSEENFRDFAALVRSLAGFENLEPPSPEAVERLKRDGLGPAPRFEAYLGLVDGKAASYAVIYDTYSSFKGMPTLYLEDLFVLPEFRRKGIGKALFDFCARRGLEKGACRMEWCALDWNRAARDFYERNGAKAQEWIFYRLDRRQMEELAGNRQEENRA